MCLCMHTHSNIYIYVYIYIHMYIYTHMYIFSYGCVVLSRPKGLASRTSYSMQLPCTNTYLRHASHEASSELR